MAPVVTITKAEYPSNPNVRDTYGLNGSAKACLWPSPARGFILIAGGLMIWHGKGSQILAEALDILIGLKFC